MKEHRRRNDRGTGSPNRRLTERKSSDFPVIYSGMLGSDMLMGDGTVNDASGEGLGISGSQSVSRGMELALFIDIPGTDDPLCIAQSRVSWVCGPRFGVEMLGQEEARQELQVQAWKQDRHRDGNRSEGGLS